MNAKRPFKNSSELRLDIVVQLLSIVMTALQKNTFKHEKEKKKNTFKKTYANKHIQIWKGVIMNCFVYLVQL